MIPALLSCVFVIYLYRSLNHPPSAADAPASGEAAIDSAGPADELAGLSRRITALENRLNQLAELAADGEAGS